MVLAVRCGAKRGREQAESKSARRPSRTSRAAHYAVHLACVPALRSKGLTGVGRGRRRAGRPRVHGTSHRQDAQHSPRPHRPLTVGSRGARGCLQACVKCRGAERENIGDCSFSSVALLGLLVWPPARHDPPAFAPRGVAQSFSTLGAGFHVLAGAAETSVRRAQPAAQPPFTPRRPSSLSWLPAPMPTRWEGILWFSQIRSLCGAYISERCRAPFSRRELVLEAPATCNRLDGEGSASRSRAPGRGAAADAAWGRVLIWAGLQRRSASDYQACCGGFLYFISSCI